MTPSLDGLELPRLPGPWLQVHRTYTAFSGVPTAWRLEHLFSLRLTADRVIQLVDKTSFTAHADPRLGFRFNLAYEVAGLTLCGWDDGISLVRAVADGTATLAILADWVEDDPHNRVKSAYLPSDPDHRVCDDPVMHMLTVMRCHRPSQRRKK
jgi:hypothetical protein